MKKMFEHRIFRCGASNFHGDEIAIVNQTHTTDRLQAIADAGFNGIFLCGKLRELAPTNLFKEYSAKADERIKELRKLCRRAGKIGLGIWLIFIEPRGLPQMDPFWQKHPGLRGHCTRIYDFPPELSLCSSTDQVRQYLHEGFSELFQKVPLAGAMLITASESVNNCWAHVKANPKKLEYTETFWKSECSCPRCAPRGPIDVVADIIKTIRHGIKSVRPDAHIVALDWSWNMYLEPPYNKLVQQLPEDVILMGDFERGGTVKRANKRRRIEEYSIIYPGPSKRFRDEVKNHSDRRSIWAKFQVNTSHELATVPNLPLIVSLYRKFKYLQQAKINGYMASIHFGCAPDTLNVFVTKKLSTKGFDYNEKKCLTKIAYEFFGHNVDAEKVVRAWYGFMRASYCYPIGGSNSFLYFSPVNEALIYPLKLKFDDTPMGGSWIKHEIGDRLEDTAQTYTIQELADLLGKLSKRWNNAIQIYETALVSTDHCERKKKELGVAKVAGTIFQSTYNIYRWYLLRKNKRTQKVGSAEQEIVANELSNLQMALPLLEADKRLGFHEEAQWAMYDSKRIKQKIASLTCILNSAK